MGHYYNELTNSSILKKQNIKLMTEEQFIKNIKKEFNNAIKSGLYDVSMIKDIEEPILRFEFTRKIFHVSY